MRIGRDAPQRKVIARFAPATAAAAADIRAASAGGRVEMLLADLPLLAHAARLARELVITPEGYEANFTGNHLGPFLLTIRLLPLLRARAP